MRRWRRTVAPRPRLRPAPLEHRPQFFPPGMTVVLRGDWTVTVSPGVHAVAVTHAGEMELRPAEPDDPLILNRGKITVDGLGPYTAHVGVPGPLWLPWYTQAVLAGALAPHILERMPPPEDPL